MERENLNLNEPAVRDSKSCRFVFVTGFFGAPIYDDAASLARSLDAKLLVLDEEIEKADGRPVRHICMLMGEHEYRNKEYEALCRITKCNGGISTRKTTVVACGDGVLLDEMSRSIILSREVVVSGANMSREQLWQNAAQMTDHCHAFMYGPDEKNRKKAFDRLYERQQRMFNGLKEMYYDL